MFKGAQKQGKSPGTRKRERKVWEEAVARQTGRYGELRRALVGFGVLRRCDSMRSDCERLVDDGPFNPRRVGEMVCALFRGAGVRREGSSFKIFDASILPVVSCGRVSVRSDQGKQKTQ